MAGVKGKSGGARPNSGGKRPGAGRKPAPPIPNGERDPLEFLLDVMQGAVEASPTQVRAAVAAAQYLHNRLGGSGKREAEAEAAKRAARGRFAPKAPPKLIVSNG